MCCVVPESHFTLFRMIIVYRISSGAQRAPGSSGAQRAPKEKPAYITKGACLRNFLECARFYSDVDRLILVEDGVAPELRAEIDDLVSDCPFPVVREATSFGNGAGSTRRAMELALAIDLDKRPERMLESGKPVSRSADPVVYFVEDDFVHYFKALDVIEDGAHVFDFVTGYDHPDKYHPNHPLVQSVKRDSSAGRFESGSATVLSRSSHFKLTTSTVMTFACRMSVLRECRELMLPFISEDYPHDNLMFWNLYGVHGRTVGSALPAVCTHGETAWLAPMPQSGVDPETFWGRIILRDPDYTAPSRTPDGTVCKLSEPEAAAIVQDLGRPDPESVEPVPDEAAAADPAPSPAAPPTADGLPGV